MVNGGLRVSAAVVSKQALAIKTYAPGKQTGACRASPVIACALRLPTTPTNTHRQKSARPQNLRDHHHTQPMKKYWHPYCKALSRAALSARSRHTKTTGVAASASSLLLCGRASSGLFKTWAPVLHPRTHWIGSTTAGGTNPETYGGPHVRSKQETNAHTTEAYTATGLKGCYWLGRITHTKGFANI